jgi:hypothetical protein
MTHVAHKEGRKHHENISVGPGRHRLERFRVLGSCGTLVPNKSRRDDLHCDPFRLASSRRVLDVVFSRTLRKTTTTIYPASLRALFVSMVLLRAHTISEGTARNVKP